MMHMRLALTALALSLGSQAQTNRDQAPQVGLYAPDHWYERLAGPWEAPFAAPVDFRNSPRIYDLLRAGRLYLSLADAIALAIENNLDVEVERFGPGIADADLLRARGGGTLRGIGYNVTEIPPGIGGPAAPLVTTPATGTLATSNVATTLAESQAFKPTTTNTAVLDIASLSAGPSIPILDPALIGALTWQHQTTPEPSPFLTGASALTVRSLSWNLGLQKGFSLGTQLSATFNTSMLNSNSLRNVYNPYTNSIVGLSITQPLLRGFGAAVNRRFIRIARNDRRISELVFEQQAIATVSGIIRLYWDLVSLIADVEVKRETVALAQRLYDDTRVQVEQGTLAPVELVRAQAQVASARQDLTNSEAVELQQELIVKNALTRRGTADAAIRDARIVPTDAISVPPQEQIQPVEDLVADALQNRPELESSRLQLVNAGISLKGTRNAVLPEIDLIGSVQGDGLAGQINQNNLAAIATSTGFVTAPDLSLTGGFGAGLWQILRNHYPTYMAGIQINLPLRNRIAQADVARDEMQTRQAEIRYQQLLNQVRIEVEGAIIDVERARAAIDAAAQTRALQEQSLKLEMERYDTGLSTTFLVMQYQSFVAQARSTEVASRGVYAKAKAELERTIGRTLPNHHISFEEAVHGQVQRGPSVPPPMVTPRRP